MLPVCCCIDVFYMHLVRFSCRTIDAPYALIPLFSHIAFVWACVCLYDCTFNECICSNHSNWARYKLQPFFTSLSHIAVFLFSICLFRWVLVFSVVVVVVPFVIKIWNTHTHLIWRNLMMCTYFILFAFLSWWTEWSGAEFFPFIERISTFTMKPKSLNILNGISLFHTWISTSKSWILFSSLPQNLSPKQYPKHQKLNSKMQFIW